MGAISKAAIIEAVYGPLRTINLGVLHAGEYDKNLRQRFGQVNVTKQDAYASYACGRGVREYVDRFFAGRREVTVEELLATLERPYNPGWPNPNVRRYRAHYLYDTILHAIARQEATAYRESWQWAEYTAFQRGVDLRDLGHELVSRITD